MSKGFGGDRKCSCKRKTADENEITVRDFTLSGLRGEPQVRFSAVITCHRLVGRVEQSRQVRTIRGRGTHNTQRAGRKQYKQRALPSESSRGHADGRTRRAGAQWPVNKGADKQSLARAPPYSGTARCSGPHITRRGRRPQGRQQKSRPGRSRSFAPCWGQGEGLRVYGQGQGC